MRAFAAFLALLTAFACSTPDPAEPIAPELPRIGERAWEQEPLSEHRFGHTVSFLGDLDADGVADIAINDVEGYWLMSGKSRTLIEQLDRSGRFSFVILAEIDDVDEDGVHDIAGFGVEKVRTGGQRIEEEWFPVAAQLSGRDRRVLRHVRIDGYDNSPIVRIDFDLDGVRDVVVHGLACTEILSGATGLRIARREKGADPRLFEWPVSMVGDVDGDGVPEFLCFEDPGRNPGPPKRVRCISGGSGAVLWQRDIGILDDCLGYCTLPCGDWNGDGLVDVAVNAPALEGPDWNYPRAVRVLSARDGVEIHRIDSTESSAPSLRMSFAVGLAVVRGPELLPELWCGSISTNFLYCDGIVEVHHPDHTVERVELPLDAPYGTSVVSGPDVDGDGYDDVLITGRHLYGDHDAGVVLLSGRTRKVIHRFRREQLCEQRARLGGPTTEPK